MSSFIEAQRLALEEMDALERALALRFRRNPALHSSSTTSSKRPHKETILQQHELRLFSEKHKKLCVRVKDNKLSRSDLFHKELAQISDPKHNFEAFDSLVDEIHAKHRQYDLSSGPAEDVLQLYLMYSSAPASETKTNTKGKIRAKRKHVLSTEAAHLDLTRIFGEGESYGRFLDLKNLFESYKLLTKSPLSYAEYLGTFHKFPYPSVNKSSAAYNNYVRDLSSYLADFGARARPLANIQLLVTQTEEEFRKSHLADTIADGQPNEKGEVFCQACNKLFAKESVYKGHLEGKRHKKNAENIQKSEYLTPVSLVKDLDVHEHLIKTLAEILGDIRASSAADAERRAAMTEREKALEAHQIAGDESDYTTVNELSENDDGENDSSDDELGRSLPLGADGRPIPFWLYKLQGLHRTHECEICGNISYKGRTAFAKHFGTPKHQHGLRCLGITDDSMGLFKNIVKIDEAQELWRRLRREQREKADDDENAVELEDEDGNVMTERDYAELKRQGLL